MLPGHPECRLEVLRLAPGNPLRPAGWWVEALALCRTWDEAITVERTEQLWAGGWQPPEQQSLL